MLNTAPKTLDPTVIGKAIKELQGLKSTIVAGVAANTKINVAGMSAQDTIVAVTKFTGGVPTDITSDASIGDGSASGTITVGTVANGNSITLGSKSYAFKTTPNPKSTSVDIPIASTPALNAAALAKAITQNDQKYVATSNAAVVTVKARAGGTVANSVALTGGTNLTASAATLTGGDATPGLKFASDTTGASLQVLWFDKQ